MMTKAIVVSRRSFSKAAAVGMTSAAISAKAYSQILGANERVNIGLLGFGLIGRIHARTFQGLPQARIKAVADAYKPRLEASKEIANEATTYHDFRLLLDDPSLDAVVVATPDHWHALQTMMACAAGKDVLVEKPMHLFEREGEWMQKIAAKHQRIVQVGTQQRSGPHYQRAKQLIREGAIGDITSVQCDFFRNIMPGIGNPPDGEPPQDFDWNMHLGPAPLRPYNPNRGIYHFRWFWDTAGGQMTNLGHHSLDIVHWIFDIQAPKAVSSHGGRWFLKDNAEVPDTQNAIIEYDRFPVIVQVREASSGGGTKSSGSLVFVGTKGSMSLSRSGFEIFPDKKIDPRNTIAAIIGGHPVGGPQPVEEPKNQFWCPAVKDESGNANQQYVLHAQNFIECIKSRATPNSDLASSHWVSTTCHLANISLRTGRKVYWDQAANGIYGDVEANAMLERSYREPWDAIRKAL
ncbi:MAG: Gfo/Idh/MocA family oxidoreductase [Pirellulaceae bacterium]|nr:Gfo/Idh/MocA family oxidoreductase [Pirellulaceae bacterium]